MSRSEDKILPPVVIDPNQRYSLSEVCAILRQSPATTYKAMREGKLPTFDVGRRTYVHGSTLIELSRPPAEWQSA